MYILIFMNIKTNQPIGTNTMNDFKNGFIQYGLDHGHIKPIKETVKKQ